MPANGIQSAAISAIHVGKRHRKEMGDIEALAESIDKLDLLHPIVVTHRGAGTYELVAGLRRLEACKHLKHGSIPIRVIDLEDLLIAERDENELRKDFTPSEAVAIGEAIEALEKKRAKERQKQAGGEKLNQPSVTSDTERKSLPDNNGSACENVPQAPAREPTALEKTAAAVGMTRPTYEAAKTVVNDGVPELVEMMDAKVVGIETAAAVAELPKDEQEAVVAQGPKAVRRKAKESTKPKSVKQKTSPKPTKPPKAGSPKIDSRPADKFYGQLVRAVDDVMKSSGNLNKPVHEKMLRCLSDFWSQWTEFKRA